MLSKRAKYALKALLAVAKDSSGIPIPARQIALSENIPGKFLEAILHDLSKAAILKSERGIHGGYTLRRAPSEIQVAEVMRIMDGPIALIPCVSENFYEKCDECHDEATCHIRKLFGEVREEMLTVLNQTVADLLKK
ncbi:MAG: Rrf2 family transcriptional regulator [Bacteroidia bacterium]|nr:Rrf2 family transcriptional regulator [Bacteroidia bacterium]